MRRVDVFFAFSRAINSAIALIDLRSNTIRIVGRSNNNKILYIGFDEKGFCHITKKPTHGDRIAASSTATPPGPPRAATRLRLRYNGSSRPLELPQWIDGHRDPQLLSRSFFFFFLSLRSWECWKQQSVGKNNTQIRIDHRKVPQEEINRWHERRKSKR